MSSYAAAMTRSFENRGSHTPHGFRNMLVQQAYKRCKTPEQFKVRSQNLGHESPLTTEQATMASTLNRMERDGLIVRSPHPQDSRAQSILLTSRVAPAMREARQVSRKALAILGPDERVQLLELMHRVVEHMKSTRSKAP